MPTETIYRRNFKAKLPKDYAFLKSLKSNNVSLRYERPENYFKIMVNQIIKDECFWVGAEYIFFTGSFSKIWVVRIFQRAWDYLFPKSYTIEYFTL